MKSIKERRRIDGAQTSDMDSGKTKYNSDSAIYTPAVRKRLNVSEARSPPFLSPTNVEINAVTQFLKRARLDVSDSQTPRKEGRLSGASAQGEIENESGEQVSEMELAKQQAEKAIIEAEKYKAALTPKGKKAQIVDVDDEFFHVTCHVETALREKCEKGEFLELEKLLPKLRLTGKNRYDSKYDQKFELVTKEGQAYVVPSTDKDNKITNIRKWEQAFRIYAAIYSQANPDRAAEIWQYVHVINTAASSYMWENVACYDMTFRHLMAANPNRSWAKIYSQGWSLAMRDPIPMARSGGSGFQHHNSKGQNKSGLKDGSCWRYNKNKCHFGQRCRYEHKCSYCWGNHPISACPKKGNRRSGPESATNGSEKVNDATST